MSTYVMQYQEARMKDPIDLPTYIFTFATGGGVALYGAAAGGLIIIDILTKIF